MYATKICNDFNEWPSSWSEGEDDLSYSRKLLEIFEEFVENLCKSGLSTKTIRRHMDNLWQLGGELVRRVNLEKKYSVFVKEHLIEHVDAEGGPYCHHLDIEEDLRSYDATCKKLFRYVTQGINSG